MAIPTEWLVGPVAALALALVVITILWKAHQAADEREIKRGDEWRDRSIATDARLDRVADAFEAIAKKAAPK